MRFTILFAALLLAQPLESLRFGRARVAESIRRRHGGITVAVEDVRKENVALIARTCEALGLASIHLIYTPEMVPQTRAFARLSDKLKRVTLSRISRSATDWIRVETHASAASFVAAARADGLRVVATTPPDAAGGARDVYDDRDDWVDGGVALCFGSEAHGLSDELLAAADLRVTVPQAGLTQSLNVASCAALVLGEVLRRRTFAPLGDGERAALEAAALAPPVRLHNKASLKREMRENAHAMKTAREVYD